MFASVAWFIHLQSNHEFLFSCAANLGAVSASFSELYLGVKQFSFAKINSGKSHKPCFIVFLRMFGRAFGYLLLSTDIVVESSNYTSQNA